MLAGSARLVFDLIPGAIHLSPGAVPEKDPGPSHTAPTCTTGSGGFKRRYGLWWSRTFFWLLDVIGRLSFGLHREF